MFVSPTWSVYGGMYIRRATDRQAAAKINIIMAGFAFPPTSSSVDSPH
jgi:hypothetical protein